MTAIGPGDFVECVSAVNTCHLPNGYAHGCVYVVEECFREFGWDALNCVGMARPADIGSDQRGWPIEAFRPIYRPRADLIETLLAPAPEMEPA